MLQTRIPPPATTPAPTTTGAPSSTIAPPTTSAPATTTAPATQAQGEAPACPGSVQACPCLVVGDQWLCGSQVILRVVCKDDRHADGCWAAV